MRIPQVLRLGKSLARRLRNRCWPRRFSALTEEESLYGQVSIQVRRIEDLQFQEQLEQVELKQEQHRKKEIRSRATERRQRSAAFVRGRSRTRSGARSTDARDFTVLPSSAVARDGLSSAPKIAS